MFGAESAWTLTDQLLALVAERVDLAASWTYYSIPMKKGAYRRPWVPLRIPRPGVDVPEPKKVRPGELGKILGKG